jgi:uncharacterized protein (TIGR03067 family)
MPTLLPELVARHADPLEELSGRELLTLLDDELQRLPEVYRLPLIMCCLEGRTQEETARQLGVTPGVVKGRLERGRAKLHGRLVRRGLTPSSALLALELSQGGGKAAVPAVLRACTSRAALAAGAQGADGGASLYATALAEGALKSMSLTKLKIAGAALLVVAALGIGAAGLGSVLLEGRESDPKQADDVVTQASGKKDKPDTKPVEPLPQNLLHAEELLRLLRDSGLVVESVKLSNKDSLFKGRDTTEKAVWVKTDQGIVEAVFFPKPENAEQVEVMPAPNGEGGRYKYTVREKPDWPATPIDANMPQYFVIYGRMFIMTDARDIEKKLSARQLEGVWQIESLQEDGKAAPDEKWITEVLFRGDKCIFKYAKLQHEAVNTIALDGTKKPKSFDVTMPGMQGRLPGIYQLDADTLKLCWSTNPDGERPDTFATKEKSGRRLAVLNRKKAVKVQTSDWGEASKGLQCRVEAPTEIEQGMLLDVWLELRIEPKKLEPGVKQLNAFLYPAFVELVLTNRTTAKRLNVKPHDPTRGMPALDQGKTVIPLDGTSPKPWPVSFPLARLGSTLEPGSYDCAVQYSFPKTPTQGWHGTGAEWYQAGFWHGTVRSGLFRLEVRKQTPRTQTFMLPKALRLERGLKVGYRSEDTEKVTFPVRNGYIVGTRLHQDGQEYRLTSGPPTPDIAQWSDYKKGDKKAAYAIELFETADPPEYGWHPGPGSGGYKVLWKKTFRLSLTEEEIGKLLAK